MRSWCRIVLLAALAIAAPPASASAATLHAAPGAARTTAPCELADPCRVDAAMTLAGFGDDVALAGGDYFQTGTTPWTVVLEVKTGVRVHGVPGGPRPVLHGQIPADATPFVRIQVGGTLADAEVRAVAAPGVTVTYAVSVGDGAALERSVVRMRGTTGTLAIACSMSGGAASNAVCHGSGQDTVHAVSATGGGAVTYRLRNVTAVTTADAGSGIRLGVSSQTSSMELTNSIARGTSTDVEARAGLNGGRATLHIDHSNWTAQATGGAGTATITPGAGNQYAGTFAPVTFADLAAGDLRPVPGSATVDAGVDAPDNGTLAVDGTARTLGAATDMGAYEAVPPAPADPGPAATPTPDPGPAASAAPGTTTPVTTPPDRLAPRITGLRVTRPARRSRSRAVTVRFRLTEAARVRLVLASRVRGRKSLRKRGTVTVRAKAGSNRVRLTRPRGRYRLTATAVDAAGNRSAARTTRFRIRR